MRKAALTSLVVVACVYATNAQLSITPKFGTEKSFTSLKYNDGQCFSPLGSVFSPQPAMRLDYKFKKTHGPFVELAGNRSVVAYSFTDPETGASDYAASPGSMQLRLGVGYQFSTKKIALGKSKPASSSTKTTAAQKQYSRCGSHFKTSTVNASRKINKAMNLRIQPFAGMAFVPNPVTAVNTIIKSNVTTYTYNAGNWNTALFTGTDFEFGKGSKRLFVVGFQYFRGLGNMNTETVHAVSTSKSTSARLRSNSGAWNITFGLPFTLSKGKQPAKQVEIKKQPEVQKESIQKKCYYKTSCGRFL